MYSPVSLERVVGIPLGIFPLLKNFCIYVVIWKVPPEHDHVSIKWIHKKNLQKAGGFKLLIRHDRICINKNISQPLLREHVTACGV